MQDLFLSGGNQMKRAALFIPFALSISLIQGCGGEEQKAESTPEPVVETNAFAKAKGKVIYKNTCIACHGEGGVGMEGLGKNWIESEFIANSSDDELFNMIKEGRPIDHPMSDGVSPMPPMGGNPLLTDEDLRNVIVYMRSLQG
jgi:mono/diheme cytochrome c family protein